MTRLNELERDINLAIGATDDPKDRAMLMLMQKILVHVEKLLSDEEALRMKVLNGDYHTHTEDHEVIQDLVKLDVINAVTWVNKTISQEKIDAETNRSRFNKFIDSIIADLPKGLIYATIAISGLSLWSR